MRKLKILSATWLGLALGATILSVGIPDLAILAGITVAGIITTIAVVILIMPS